MSAYEAAITGAFADAKPKAVDFPQKEYEVNKELFNSIAAQHGYRLAGMRLERAVFTSKPAP